MMIDGREVASEAVLTADVCIVGAGPAGLALASELDGTGLDVCVVESGGHRLDHQIDELNDLAAGDGDFETPNGTRRRQFGGTSNMWQVRLRGMSTGARYLPLTPLDFETRDWVPGSGWPFGLDELAPYYRRAHPVCGLGPFEYSNDVWSEPGAMPLPLDGDVVRTTIEHFGNGDVFNRRHREALERSTNVTVVLHSTVTELRQEASGGRVDLATVQSSGRSAFSVRATTYVVATGAIETARLLLLSTAGSPAGLGNEHDLVGRHYMDHLWVSAGRLVPQDRHLFNEMGMYDLRTVRGSTVRAKLVLSDRVQREHELLNSAIELLPKPQAEIYGALRSMREIARSARRGKVPPDLGTKLRSIGPGARYIIGTGTKLAINQRRIPPSVDAGWSQLSNNHRRFESLEAIQQIELSPDPANRVTLVDEPDAFGQRRARVDWRFTPLDVRSARASQALFAEQFTHDGVGVLEIPDREAPLDVLSPVGIYHQLGTTRMSSAPSEGVVDPGCRVHTVPNVFVAGGAVFPTGGYANCTLTIVALALRLADRLRAELAPATAASGRVSPG